MTTIKRGAPMPPSVSNGKTKPDKKVHPINVIRNGAIAASVWKRQTSSGFEYLDFSLSRSWKLKNGQREGYSQNFFESNADAIKDVIERTCQFIRSRAAEQLTDPSPIAQEPHAVGKQFPARVRREIETASARGEVEHLEDFA
jgi:hypothetical protein